jgi:periplasmic protein TonB
MATSPAADYRSPAGMPLDGILLAEELLDLAERAQAYTNAAGVMIALMRGKELLVRTSAGAAPEVGTAIPATDAFLAECLQRGKPLSCHDTEADSRVGQIFRASKTRSLIAIPIAGQPEPRGVMLVIAPLPNAFQPTHTAILMTLCDIISSKLAAREAPSDAAIEMVNDPAPALTVVNEASPKPAVPEMPVIAATPMVAAPPSTVAAPAATKVAPPSVESAPLPAEAAPVSPAVEAKAALPELPVVRSAKPAEPQPEPAAIATPAAIASPAVMKAGPMPLVEQKKSQREPGLLSPSEDPGRFKPQHAFGANTVTTVRPQLVKINSKPVAPVAIAATTTASAQPVSFAATPAITSWETPRQQGGMRRYLVPALAVAAVLVVAAVLWMRRSTAPQSPPDLPVPVAAAVTPAPPAFTLTPAAPAPVAPQVKLVAKAEPGVKVVEEHAQPKPAKTPESQAAPAPAKHEPAPPMEIAAARPKPRLEPEPEMSAPRLTMASTDNAVAALSKLAVARPVPPKSELVPATLISRTVPVYPAAARQLGIFGTVVLSVTVTPEGSVGEVSVVDGAIQLRAAAVNAVRQWRYRPATLNGKAVESSAHVQVKFSR